MTWGVVQVRKGTGWETFGERFYFRTEALTDTAAEVEAALPERTEWHVVDDHGRTVASGDTRKGVKGGRCATLICEARAVGVAFCDGQTGTGLYRCDTCIEMEGLACQMSRGADDARMVADQQAGKPLLQAALRRVADMWEAGHKAGLRPPEPIPSLLQYAKAQNARKAAENDTPLAEVEKFYPVRTYQREWWADVIRRFEVGDSMNAYLWGQLSPAQQREIEATKRARTDPRVARRLERMSRG